MKPIILLSFVVTVFTMASFTPGHAANGQIQAAITQQINQINPKTDKVDSMIEIVTVVNSPAHVGVGKIRAPRGIRVLGVTQTGKPCTLNAAKCKQRFSIKLDANKNCRLNGDYTISAEVRCPRNAAGAACSAGFEPIKFSLQSENFCAEKTTTLDCKKMKAMGRPCKKE